MLSHVSGWPHSEVMALPLGELQAWCEEAVKLWNRLHAPAPD